MCRCSDFGRAAECIYRTRSGRMLDKATGYQSLDNCCSTCGRQHLFAAAAAAAMVLSLRSSKDGKQRSGQRACGHTARELYH